MFVLKGSEAFMVDLPLLKGLLYLLKGGFAFHMTVHHLHDLTETPYIFGDQGMQIAFNVVIDLVLSYSFGFSHSHPKLIEGNLSLSKVQKLVFLASKQGVFHVI